MIDKKDMQEYIKFVEQFRNNVIRSLNIRLKISQNRIQAIRILEKNHQDEGGIKLLKRCIKNERWFLRIIQKGLEESLDKLKDIYAWLKLTVKSKELKDNAKRLIEIIEIFYFRLEDIENRLQLEGEFIEKQDKDSFRRFVRQWRKEIRLNTKLLKKVVDVDDLETYFKRIDMSVRNLGTQIGAVATTVGLGGIAITSNVTPNYAILILMPTLTFCIGISTTLKQLKYVEKQIEQMNLDELKRAKKVVNRDKTGEFIRIKKAGV